MKTLGVGLGRPTQSHGKAREGLKCGKCEQSCSRHLRFRKFLGSVAGEAEQGKERHDGRQDFDRLFFT